MNERFKMKKNNFTLTKCIYSTKLLEPRKNIKAI